MIGGNSVLTIYERTVSAKNSIGERTTEWTEKETITGYLDLQSGSADSARNTKIQSATHVFISDYFLLNYLNVHDLKAKVGAREFDVLYIDDPMMMHNHLEIYLEEIE